MKKREKLMKRATKLMETVVMLRFGTATPISQTPPRMPVSNIAQILHLSEYYIRKTCREAISNTVK